MTVDDVRFVRRCNGWHDVYRFYAMPGYKIGSVLKVKKASPWGNKWAFLPLRSFFKEFPYSGYAIGHSRKYAVGLFLRGEQPRTRAKRNALSSPSEEVSA